MVGAYRLPLRFDPGPLLREVREIEEHATWLDHWGGRSGGWGVVSLVSSDGDHRARESIYFAGTGPGRATALLHGAPSLRAAIDAFGTTVLHARLSRLRPGASIRPHRDFGYSGDQRWSFERGFIRVHVPIQTGEGVHWRLHGERIDMQPGEAWYLNVCRQHSVENSSDVDRIHLVLELELNDWLRSLFPPENLWGRLHSIALRRLEPPIWKLAKPFVTWNSRRRSERRPSPSGALSTPRDEVSTPEGQHRSERTIGHG
jgi:hypothetical protein